jgi:hypothetical protein
VEDRDPVGERHRLGLIVGDVDEADAGAPVELLELPAHPLAELRIQVRQGLVEEQDRRLDDEAPGQRHALLLPPGELAREARLEPVEIHQL